MCVVYLSGVDWAFVVGYFIFKYHRLIIVYYMCIYTYVEYVYIALIITCGSGWCWYRYRWGYHRILEIRLYRFWFVALICRLRWNFWPQAIVWVYFKCCKLLMPLFCFRFWPAINIDNQGMLYCKTSFGFSSFNLRFPLNFYIINENHCERLCCRSSASKQVRLYDSFQVTVNTLFFSIFIHDWVILLDAWFVTLLCKI